MDKRIKVISAIAILCLLFFFIGLRVGVTKNSGNSDAHSLVNPYLFCDIHKDFNVSYCDEDIVDNCIEDNEDLIGYATDVLGFYLANNSYIGGGDYIGKIDRE